VSSMATVGAGGASAGNTYLFNGLLDANAQGLDDFRVIRFGSVNQESAPAAPAGLTVVYRPLTGMLEFNWSGHSPQYYLMSSLLCHGPYTEVEAVTSDTTVSIPQPGARCIYYAVVAVGSSAGLRAGVQTGSKISAANHRANSR
jgi:hypothetical protein